jgi:chromosome segregation ATPase
MSVENAHFQGIELTYREIDALEREFQTILQDLAGNQSLLRFRHEYERLYRALRRSHENERILFNKISELSRDMNDQTAKIKTAMRMAHEDTQSINFLKQELDKIFKLLDVSKEREEKNKAKIEKIQGRIRFLTARLEEKKALSSEQSNTLMQLNDEKDALTKLKEKKNQELADLKARLSETLETEREQEVKRQEYSFQKDNLDKEMKEVRDKYKKDCERKKKIEEEVDSLFKQRTRYKDELKQHQENNKALEKKIEDKERDIHNLSQEIEEYHSESQKVRAQILGLKEENDSLVHGKSERNENLRRLDSAIQNLKKKLNEQLSKVAQTEKSNDKLRNQTVKLNGEVNALVKENEVRLESLKQMERQIVVARKLNAEDEKYARELTSEREHLIHELDKQRHISNKLTDRITLADKEIQELEDKITSTDGALEELKKKVVGLEKDKEKYGKQAALANAKFMQTVEEIKLKGNLISEFQKKNLETENKLKHHQQLYETVRSDRNTYSKNLSETED